MSILTNECEADRAVIESLLLTLAAYQKEIITMSIVLFKDEDGEVKRASNFEDISRGEIEDRITELSDELSQWQSALSAYDQITGTTTEEAPADVPVEPTEVPAEPVAPVEPVVEAPVEPTPVEPVVAPATPEQQPVDISTTDVPAPTQLQ